MGLDVKTLRRSFNFKVPGIEKGTTLKFSRDKALTGMVFDFEKKVNLMAEPTRYD